MSEKKCDEKACQFEVFKIWSRSETLCARKASSSGHGILDTMVIIAKTHGPYSTTQSDRAILTLVRACEQVG
jgi:hypothetical protein